jgi:hypothetical protein
MQNLLSKYFLPIIICLSAILALLRFDSLQIGISYDDAHYIILAESLSSKQGYQLINFPHAQVERAFPPGFPLLLTPLTFLFPGNYSILKLFSLILWLISIYLIYQLFSKRLSSPYLEILITLVALNPLLIGTSVTVMSESAYLFFSLLALYLFDGVGHALHPEWVQGVTTSLNKKSGYKPDLRIIFISILIFYTQMIRTIGIALFVAFIFYLLFTRRFREIAIPVTIFVIGTLIQRLITGSLISTGYQSQVFNSSISEKIGQVFSNIIGYYNEVVSSSLFPIFGSRLDSVLENYGLGFIPFVFNIIILFLIAFGMFRTNPKLEWMHLYFVIYVLGILAFWNPDVGSVKARFLIPILSFLYFYFLNGIKFFGEKLKRPNMVFVIAVLFSIPLLARNVQDIQNPVKNQITDLSIGANWVAENTPADSIVMVNEPVPVYPHVQRQTINFPKQNQDLIKYLDNQGIDYIIISPLLQSPRSLDLEPVTANQILPTLQSAPDLFVLVYKNIEDNVFVYQYRNEN